MYSFPQIQSDQWQDTGGGGEGLDCSGWWSKSGVDPNLHSLFNEGSFNMNWTGENSVSSLEAKSLCQRQTAPCSVFHVEEHTSDSFHSYRVKLSHINHQRHQRKNEHGSLGLTATETLWREKWMSSGVFQRNRKETSWTVSTFFWSTEVQYSLGVLCTSLSVHKVI